MTNTYNVFDRVNNPQYIGDLRDGDQLGFLGEQVRQQIGPQMAFLIYRKHLQHRAFSLAHHLPGNDVTVMLGRGNDNLVSLSDESLAIGERNEIDGGGGA